MAAIRLFALNKILLHYLLYSHVYVENVNMY